MRPRFLPPQFALTALRQTPDNDRRENAVEIARVVCMQCGRTIRDFKIESGLVSHGLCVDCGAEFARQIDALEPDDAPALAQAPLAVLAAAR